MKRLTIGLTATAIITLGVFAFSGCEKEDNIVSQQSVIQQNDIEKAGKPFSFKKKVKIPPTTITDTSGTQWTFSGSAVVEVTISPFNIDVIHADITIVNNTTGERIRISFSVLRDDDGNEIGFEFEEGEIVEEGLFRTILEFINNNIYSWELEDL